MNATQEDNHSKSELKRQCVLNPLGMAEKMHALERELAAANAKLSDAQKQLAAYEAEPVRGYEGAGTGRLYTYDQAIEQHLSADGSYALIRKPPEKLKIIKD